MNRRSFAESLALAALAPALGVPAEALRLDFGPSRRREASGDLIQSAAALEDGSAASLVLALVEIIRLEYGEPPHRRRAGRRGRADSGGARPGRPHPPGRPESTPGLRRGRRSISSPSPRSGGCCVAPGLGRGAGRASLDRLERLGPAYNAVVRVLRESALAEARERDAELARGKDRGPLHGIPYGVKDLLAVDGRADRPGERPGYRTPAATRATPRWSAGCGEPARCSAPSWRWSSSRAAWATDRPFASFAGPGPHAVGPARWSGGSSSGPGAAVAAGLVPFAIGSETWGSIQYPGRVLRRHRPAPDLRPGEPARRDGAEPDDGQARPDGADGGGLRARARRGRGLRSGGSRRPRPPVRAARASRAPVPHRHPAGHARPDAAGGAPELRGLARSARRGRGRRRTSSSFPTIPTTRWRAWCSTPRRRARSSRWSERPGHPRSPRPRTGSAATRAGRAGARLPAGAPAPAAGGRGARPPAVAGGRASPRPRSRPWPGRSTLPLDQAYPGVSRRHQRRRRRQPLRRAGAVPDERHGRGAASRRACSSRAARRRRPRCWRSACTIRRARNFTGSGRRDCDPRATVVISRQPVRSPSLPQERS